uniref:Uncharacterized protein n=1 Tax=Parascaris univalens TaxID=6257 RepID=A0A915ADW1_PARUN
MFGSRYRDMFRLGSIYFCGQRYSQLSVDKAVRSGSARQEAVFQHETRHEFSLLAVSNGIPVDEVGDCGTCGCFIVIEPFRLFSSFVLFSHISVLRFVYI